MKLNQDIFLKVVRLFQDIENVDDEPVGVAQYSDADVILPNSDNAESEEDANERLELRNTLLKNVTENLTNKIADANDDVGNTSFDLANIPDLNCDLKKLVTKLMADNEELKKQTVCKICMDAIYNKPLVTTIFVSIAKFMFILLFECFETNCSNLNVCMWYFVKLT